MVASYTVAYLESLPTFFAKKSVLKESQGCALIEMSFQEFKYWFVETRELTSSEFNGYVQQRRLYRHTDKENVYYLYLGEHSGGHSPNYVGAIPYREFPPRNMVPHIKLDWYYTFPPDRTLAQNDRTQLIKEGNLYRKNDGSECCYGGSHFFSREAHSDFATKYQGGQWDNMNLTRVKA